MKTAQILMLTTVAALAPGGSAHGQWTLQASGVDAELRGLSVVSPTVAWASGQRGTVIRTMDGGRTWTSTTVPGAATLDLRSIAATSARTAYALSIGDSGRVFRTTNGGVSWTPSLVGARKGSFFDAVRFWDARHGIVISDAVDGFFLILTTSDGGESWQEVPTDRLPPALANEGAFAASGSALTVHGEQEVWFATGVAPIARVFHSRDRGRSWTVANTPIRAGASVEGAFSIDFHDARQGVVAGGDYQKPREGGRNLALTTDGGATWTLVDSATSPQGFRSAVTYIPGTGGRQLVAVGLSGTDVSTDGGRTWRSTDTTTYNSVEFSGPAGFAVGPRGRVARYSARP